MLHLNITTILQASMQYGILDKLYLKNLAIFFFFYFIEVE